MLLLLMVLMIEPSHQETPQSMPQQQQQQSLATPVQQYALNLQANVTELLRPSDDFIYSDNDTFATLDTYLNTCLNKMETCSDGFTIIFDIRLVYPSRDQAGRSSLVLATSGGHSPYSPAGFHLTQTNSRGENYLEFGLCFNDNLYKSHVRSTLYTM